MESVKILSAYPDQVSRIHFRISVPPCATLPNYAAKFHDLQALSLDINWCLALTNQIPSFVNLKILIIGPKFELAYRPNFIDEPDIVNFFEKLFWNCRVDAEAVWPKLIEKKVKVYLPVVRNGFLERGSEES